MQRTSAALCALLAGAGFAATTATSSQAAEPNRFTCSAQPLTAKVAGQSTFAPTGAGSETGSCGNSTGGGVGTLPLLGTLEGVYASTSISPSADVAPALQQPSARSGVLNVQLAGAVGFRIQGVTSQVSAACSGGAARFASSGGVTGVSVAGQAIPLVDGALTQVPGLGGVLGGLPVRLELNRVTQDASGYAFRAVRVVAPADGSVLDVSAGLTRIGIAGSPCTDGPGPTPGPTPGPSPAPGPGGSAASANLLFPAGYAYLRRSPCITSRAFGVKPGILGNARPNRLKGTKRANRIMGYNANDRLTGGGGRDCLEGGAGNDVESGGAKGDILFGRQGKDKLDGGAGNDRLAGASGVDRLTGGKGNDRLAGESGNDRISAGSGNDRATGGAGKDRISGGAGKDRLSGGAGNDRITGGSGRDRITCGKGRDVAIIGKGDKAARDCERVIRKRGKRF